MTATFSHGAFVFYRVGAQCQPMTPAEISALVTNHRLPTSMVPAYAGDRAQVSRAITSVKGGLARKGWVLTALKTKDHEVAYSINALHKNQAQERADMPYADTLRWSDEGGNGVSIEGQHPVARDVDAAYQGLRGKICAGDWAATITAYLRDDCYAQAMRDDGRIFWVAAQHTGQLGTLDAFLQRVGIHLVVCQVEAEAVPVVQQAAREGLAEQLQALEDAVAAFDGDQKPSNYRARLQEIAQLRARATAYQAALGIGVEQAQAVLDQLQAQVARLLDVRQTRTVPRSSSAPRAPIAYAYTVDDALRDATAARARVEATPVVSALGAVRAQMGLW